MMPTGFDARAYLPREVYDGITDVRVRQPSFADGEGDRRARRRAAAPDGRLIILAADHPGCASVRVEDDSMARGDRHGYLARILRALSHPGMDGIVATPDVVEDLLILAGLVRERGGQSPLDERLLIGCMNDRGFPGTDSPMDDRFTAFTARRMAILGLDGGKLTVRVDPMDRGSLASCARAVSDLAEASLLAILELVPVGGDDGAHAAVRAPQALAEAVRVVSALGASSLYTWLAVPACPDLDRVAGATTLPILVLGDEAAPGQRALLEDLRGGLGAGSNARGVLVGPGVLYPGTDDPRAVAAAVTAIVRDGAGIDEALAAMEAERGKDPELV
jgi:hypothetical protein